MSAGTVLLFWTLPAVTFGAGFYIGWRLRKAMCFGFTHDCSDPQCTDCQHCRDLREFFRRKGA